MNQKKIIVLDCETTGLDDSTNEILQLSIIDENENILMNQYFKPSKCEEWPDAERVNGISPNMVKNMPKISEYINEIQQIIDDADVIVGYNLAFDMGFLLEAGISFSTWKTDFADVMLEFAEIYGEWSEYYNGWKWQKLTTCASYYDYKWEEYAHNSLGDVKATLYCYNKIKDYLENQKKNKMTSLSEETKRELDELGLPY